MLSTSVKSLLLCQVTYPQVLELVCGYLWGKLVFSTTAHCISILLLKYINQDFFFPLSMRVTVPYLFFHNVCLGLFLFLAIIQIYASPLYSVSRCKLHLITSTVPPSSILCFMDLFLAKTAFILYQIRHVMAPSVSLCRSLLPRICQPLEGRKCVPHTTPC